MDLKPYNIGNTTCGSCNKMYSTREKVASSFGPWRSYIPLILQCAHTVCEFCIETALREQGKIFCPECKKESVPSQPIETIILENQIRVEFPVNVYLMGELLSTNNIRLGNSVLSSNLLTQVPTNNVKKKEQCNECSQQEAILKCQQCADKFCDSCFKTIHSSSKALSRHIALPLASPSPLCCDEELLIKQTLPVTESKCLTHPSQYLVMYCNECQLALCTSCFFKNHKEHPVLSIEEKNASIVEELKIAMDNALPVLQRLKFNYQKLKSGTHSVHAPNASSMKELQQVEKNIRCTMSSLHALLQLKEKQLIHALACFSNGTRKLTSDMATEIQANIKSLDTLVENARTVIASPHMYSLEVDKLLDRLKAVPDHTPCHIVTSQVDVNAAKPKFKIDLESVKAALTRIDLEIPQDASPLSLLSTVDLPDGYSIPPIAPAVMQTSDPKLIPSSRPLSAMSVKSCRSDSNSLVEVPSTTSDLSCPSIRIIKDFGDVKPPTCPAPSAIIPCMPEEVSVVHVETPSDFYVQRKAAQPQLQKIDYLIQPHYVQKQKPPNRVNLNDLYLAQFEGKWYRARVTQLPPAPDAPLNIFYVDWGNRISLPKSKLRPCPPQLKAIPALAVNCSIYDCLPALSRDRTWSPETIKYFVSLVLKEDDASSVSMQVYSVLPHTEQYCVDLHVVGEYGTTSVRTSLLAVNYAIEAAQTLPYSRTSSLDSFASKIEPGPPPCKSSITTDAISVTPETELPRHVLVDITVSHVESPDYFCVHKASNLSAIARLSDELQMHYGDSLSYNSTVTTPDIVIGRIVACKVDSKWYRGFIVEKIVEEVGSELDPDVLIEEVRQVRVYCIDYGYKVLLPVEDILKLHSKFFKMAAQALKCSLFGIAPAHPPPDGSADASSARDKKHSASWPNNIVEVLSEMIGAGKGVILSAASHDTVKGGIQRVILYKRDGAKEECINKKLVDMKIAKAISPRISAARHKNLEKSAQPSASAPKKPMLTYQEKMKKHKWVKKQKGSRHPDYSSANFSSSESTNEVSDLESDPEVEPVQVDALRASYKQVVISHIQDPYHVYVTPSSRQKKLQDFSDLIQAHYKLWSQKISDAKEWNVNDKCIAYYAANAIYGRALVKSIDNNQAEVHFIDVGTRDSVPLSSLLPIQPEFTGEIDGTVACRLSGIVCADGTDVWPDFVTAKLREIVEENRGFLYIYKSGNMQDHILPIHLWVKKSKVAGPFSPSVTTWVCVNKLLVSEACAHATEPDEFIGKHFESPYTSDTLGNSDAAQIISAQMKSQKTPLPPCGASVPYSDLAYPVALHSAEVKDWLPAEPLSNLKLQIKPTNVDYYCRIYFIDPENSDLLEQIQTVLSAKYRNSSVRDSDFYWTEGQVCTAKYHLDSCWYRGKIVELEDEEGKYGVYFIDYGNTESCTPNELRKEACYHEVPALAVYGILDGLEPVDKPGVENKEGWPTSTLDIIHGLIVDKQLNITLLPPVVPGGPYRIQEMILTGSGENIIQTLLDSDLVKRSSAKKADTKPVTELMKKPVQVLPEEVEQLPLQQDAKELEDEDNTDSDVLVNINLPPTLKDISWYEASEIESLCRAALNYSFPPSAISPREGNVLKVHVKFIVSLRPYVSVSVTLAEPMNDEVRRVMAEFSELHSTIQREASEQPLLRAPGPDMACIACTLDEDDEETWHRACVLPENSPATPDTVPVLCVDTGIKEQVSRDSIRAVKEDWTQVPVQAVTCIVHGVDVAGEMEESDVMQELLDMLSERDEDYAFMKIKKCSYNGSLMVDLFEDPETTVFLYQPLIDSGSFLMEVSQ